MISKMDREKIVDYHQLHFSSDGHWLENLNFHPW